MLNSTPTSLGGASPYLLVCDADAGAPAHQPGFLNGANLHHGQEKPDERKVNGKACELVAGTRAERTGTARATQRADKTAPLAALNQYEQNQKCTEQYQDQIQRTG